MSKRGKIVRNIPLALMTVVAGIAVKSAIDCKEEYDNILERTDDMLAVPEGLMDEVRSGNTLMVWTDKNGMVQFQTSPGQPASKI